MIEALIGILALGAPVAIVCVLVALTERPDGRTRLVISGGRMRRRP